MSDPADFTRLFVEGHAQLLTDAGIGLTRDPSGEYTAPGGIYIPTLPADTPGLAVWMAAYPLADDPALSDSAIGLQIGARAPSWRAAVATDDAIADALLGLYGYTLSTGIAVSTLTRSSSTSPTREDEGTQRWSKASNYTAIAHRPSLHRI